MLDAVIIGGGLAGLAAARRLVDSGARVLVLEKENRLGGRLWTRGWKEGTAEFHEVGAQFFTRKFKELRRLAKNLQVPLLPVPFLLRMRVGEEWKRARYDRWSLFLNLPGVPWNVRSEIFRLVWDALRYGGEDRELREYAKRFAPDIYDYLIAPYYQTMFFSDPDSGSTRHFFAHFGPPFSQRIYRPQGGMSRLVEALARRIPVRTGAEALAVESLGGRVLVTVRTDEGSEGFYARYAIVAVPGDRVLGLAGSRQFTPEAACLLQTVEYAATAVVSVRMAEPVRRPIFGFSVPPKHASMIAGGVICNKVWDVMLTDRAYREFQHLSDRRLTETALGELVRIAPEWRPLIEDAQICRWKSAIPRFRPGFIRRAESLAERPHSRDNRIHLAGDYLELGCSEGAASSGIRAAGRVLACLRHSGRIKAE